MKEGLQQAPQKAPFNPQNPTPSNKHTKNITFQSEFLLTRIEAFLQEQKYGQALSLPLSSFLKGLIFDHIEVNRTHSILMSEVGTVEFDKIKNKYPTLLSFDRQTRLRTLYNLKKNRSLNTKLVSQVATNLQDILLDQFDPLQSYNKSLSQVFVQLYQRLNEIHRKIQLLKTNNPQFNTFIDSKTLQLYSCNKTLKQKLERAQNKAQRYQKEACNAMNELLVFKNEMGEMQKVFDTHEKDKLQMRIDFNQQLQRKQAQYARELQELRTNKHVAYQVTCFEEDLTFTIQEFKNLILKLNLENKLLKEERDLLLGKLTRIYEKIHIFSTYCKSNQHQDILTPVQDDSASCLTYNNNLIELLKGRQAQLEQQLAVKNDIIKKREDELKQLRQGVVRKESGSSDQTKKQRKYKRSHANEQSSKLIQLQELRRKDKETIESLSQIVQSLTNKLKHHLLLPQQQPLQNIDLNLSLWRLREQQEIANTFDNMGKISTFSGIEQQRHTNVSFNSSVLTPRVKNESKCSLNVQQLISKCQALEQEMRIVREQKEQLVKSYELQLQQMQQQIGEEQLSVISLECRVEQLEEEVGQERKALFKYRG